MNINNGDTISIRHYSGLHPFKSIVVSCDEDIIVVKLIKEFAAMNFLEGDPLVFGYEDSKQVNIIGSNIISINPKQNTITLKLDKIDSEAQKRMYERYPVSVYADLRSEMENKKKYLGIIKDISNYGLLIYSKQEFLVGIDIDIDMYLENKMIFLKAKIVRKLQQDKYFEYGTTIKYDNSNTMQFVREYIKRLTDSQSDSIKKIKQDY